MATYKIVSQNVDLTTENDMGKTTFHNLHYAKASGILFGHPATKDDLELLNKKINCIIDYQGNYPEALPFNVIMLGETFEEFSNNSLMEISLLMKNRCNELFENIPDDFIKKALLIYEPKWAVNPNDPEKNLPPSEKLISRVTNKMRDFLTERLGIEGNKVSLMYGEVSSPERAVEILANENLQGLMLGSACKSKKQLMEIIKALQFHYDKRKIILVCNFKSFILEENYQSFLETLAIVPDNFTIYFAPPATDIRYLRALIDK